MDLLAPLAERRVLDLGCGDGALIARLADVGAIVVGIDADPAMVAAARARAPMASLAAADALHLPFLDSTFDVVVANTVLCLVGNRRAALAEAVRVLRPGGVLAIGELGRWSLWAMVRKVRGWLGSPLWRASSFVDPRSLTAELVRAGLTVRRIRGAIFYPPWGLMARWTARFDRLAGRITTFGAAYLVAIANK